MQKQKAAYINQKNKIQNVKWKTYKSHLPSV